MPGRTRAPRLDPRVEQRRPGRARRAGQADVRVAPIARDDPACDAAGDRAGARRDRRAAHRGRRQRRRPRRRASRPRARRRDARLLARRHQAGQAPRRRPTRSAPTSSACPATPPSAIVTFTLFGLPLLRAMQGDARPVPMPLRAALTAARKRSPDRLELVRAALQLDRTGARRRRGARQPVLGRGDEPRCAPTASRSSRRARLRSRPERSWTSCAGATRERAARRRLRRRRGARMGGAAQGPAADGRRRDARRALHSVLVSVGAEVVLVGASDAYAALGFESSRTSRAGVGPARRPRGPASKSRRSRRARARVRPAVRERHAARAPRYPRRPPPSSRRGATDAGSRSARATIRPAVLPVIERLLAARRHALQAVLDEAGAVALPLSEGEAMELRDWDVPSDVPRPGSQRLQVLQHRAPVVRREDREERVAVDAVAGLRRRRRA